MIGSPVRGPTTGVVGVRFRDWGVFAVGAQRRSEAIVFLGGLAMLVQEFRRVADDPGRHSGIAGSDDVVRYDAPSAALTVSVVIPTKNEAQNVGWVLERIGPLVDEIVVVDGLSDDGTVQAAIEVRPDVVVVDHPVAGKGEAVRAGFEAATGDLVVLMDADGSMDPAEIPGFVEELARGADFVKGSRFLPGGGTSDITPLRSFGNAVLVRLANVLLGTSYTELCYGYMAFRRTRLRELDLQASGFEIETELVVKACRAGLSVTEIASFESPRRYGASNLNTFRDGWRVLRTLVRERYARRAEPAPSTVSAG